MEAADDIALGEFSKADLDDLIAMESIDERSIQPSNSLRGFRLSVALSACIHLVLASTAMYFIDGDFRSDDDLGLATFRVEFVYSNPLSVQAEQSFREHISESSLDPEQANSSIPPEKVVTAQPVVEERQYENTEPETADAVEIEIAEAGSTSRPAVEAELIVTPSIDSVRSAINAVQSSETSQFYSYDCTKLEKQRTFNNCAPSDARDYSYVARNPVYEFYNPAVGISRSRKTVTTIARQSANVSTALALSNLPVGLSDYVLEEIEQGIETYSNKSSRAVSHMNTIVDKSAAGAMSRSIFDHWVVQQSAILNGRRVENRRDSQFEEKCKSDEKFTMVPAEFARCLFLGVSPLERSIKL